MRFIFNLLSLLTVLCLLTAVSFVVYDFSRTRAAFPPRTFIGGINVSLLSQEDALEFLSSTPVSSALSPVITLEADNLLFSLPPEKLGITIRPEESVSRAFEQTHKRPYLKELAERLTTKETVAPLVLDVDKDQLQIILQLLANETRTTSADASIYYNEETGGYNIYKDTLGRELNVERSIAVFKKEINLGKTTIPLAFNYTYPHVREEVLRTHPPVYRLSAYTTYYGRHDSPNRIHNIKLIASWITDRLLLSGEVFSLSDAIGEFTADRGFKEAFVISGGMLVPQLGGGTCQIGTTLYNTASLADLEILQRRNHSFYFNIYPLGRDATVYPHQADLKFKNNTGCPILIKALATDKRLSFRIYGTPTGKKVKFSPPSVFILSSNGAYIPSTIRQVLASDSPFKTVVTRTVFNPSGNKISEEEISSFYKLYGEKTNVPIARPEPR